MEMAKRIYLSQLNDSRLPVRNKEQSAERKDHASIAARGIGTANKFKILRDKLRSLPVISQRLKKRPQARSLIPFHDPGSISHEVLVLRLPEIHLCRIGSEDVVISRQVMSLPFVNGIRRETTSPGWRFHQFAHEAMRGSIEIAGHLHSQRASGGQTAQKPGKNRSMIPYPLQSSIAKHDIVRRAGPMGPVVYGTPSPNPGGRGWAPRIDHVLRAVQPSQFSFWPAFGKDARAVSGATAQINHATGRGDGDTRGQFPARPGALVVEAEILFSVPGRHGNYFRSQTLASATQSWNLRACSRMTKGISWQKENWKSGERISFNVSKVLTCLPDCSKPPSQFARGVYSSSHVYGEVIINCPPGFSNAGKCFRHFRGSLRRSMRFAMRITSKRPRSVRKFSASPRSNATRRR